MSRTFRRTDSHGLEFSGRYTDTDRQTHRYHGDNHHKAFGPDKEWRRISHKKSRAAIRNQIQAVMRDEDHEVIGPKKDHGLSLWDWY